MPKKQLKAEPAELKPEAANATSETSFEELHQQFKDPAQGPPSIEKSTKLEIEEEIAEEEPSPTKIVPRQSSGTAVCHHASQCAIKADWKICKADWCSTMAERSSRASEPIET